MGKKSSFKFLGSLLAKFLPADYKSKVQKVVRNAEGHTEKQIALGELIWVKSKELKKFEDLEPFEKNFLYIDWFEAELNNGGLDQFFFNHAGNYAHQTLEALNEVKAFQMAIILAEAIEVFPASSVPEDSETRRGMMENLQDYASEKWDELDNRFYEYPDDLAKLVLAYFKNQFELQ